MFRRCIRRTATVLACCGFIVSLALWLAWASDLFYRGLPAPAVAVRASSVLCRACALRDGLHFVAMQGSAGQRGIRFDRATHLGNTGYRHGTVVNFLGFVVAVLPETFSGGDYTVSPHAAFVLPYWALIVGFGWASLCLTGLSTFLAPYRKWSRVSLRWAFGVLVLFAVLNLIPSESRPGMNVRPQGFFEWVLLTLFPDPNGAKLSYGFPFVCFSRGIINGQAVAVFHGTETGWARHRAMENVCIAIIAMFGTGIAVEWVRSRTQRAEVARRGLMLDLTPLSYSALSRSPAQVTTPASNKPRVRRSGFPA